MQDVTTPRVQFPTTFDLFKIHPETTDTGNADRFAVVSGDDFRFCALWKKWIRWDCRRWAIDECEAILERAMKFIRYCRSVAETFPNGEEKSQVLSWLGKSESHAKLTAMLSLARAKLSVIPDSLDSDPWLFNVQNGTLDLRTGEIRPHDRADMITKISPVEYRPFEECPKWKKFLEEILLGRQEVINYLKRFLGYCLTGLTREQLFVIAWGLGENGKTVIANVLLHIFGDYAGEFPTESLMVRKNEGIPNDLAALRGCRLAMFAESESGQRLAESRLKSLTGGDLVAARYLYGEFFSFTPQCKLILRTNHRPHIRGTDHAIWRRVSLIPFEYKVPADKKNAQLTEELKAEASGIFNWLIEGCMNWQQEGLKQPVMIEEATEDYRQEEDVLGDFLKQKTATDVSGRTQSKTLYDAYVGYCQANGLHELSQKAFSMTLEERGMKKIKAKNGNYWHGILLQLSEATSSQEDQDEIPF